MRIEDVSNRAELERAIADLSDDEIAEKVQELGADLVLKKLFTVCADVYDPTKGPRSETVVHWQVSDNGDTHDWYMIADRSRMICTQSHSGSPTVTARLEVPLLMRIMARVSNGVVEVAKGRIRLSGNAMAVMDMDSWFPAD